MTDLVPLPETVLEWGRGNLRDLPWRQTRDPWEVLVAEVMLQQTQVQRVVNRHADQSQGSPLVVTTPKSRTGVLDSAGSS